MTYKFNCTAVLSAVIFFVLSADSSEAQPLTAANLKGVWQEGTSTLSSALQANFQFYEDGRFVYNNDSYDELNPLKSISGQYLIKGNTLHLRVLKMKMLTNFKIVESDPGVEFGTFKLSGGKLVTINQQDTGFSVHELSVVKKPGKDQSEIHIDSDKYFKISDEPDKFEKNQ